MTCERPPSAHESFRREMTGGQLVGLGLAGAMLIARIAGIVVLTLVAGSALTCRLRANCASGEQISVGCAEELVSGFRAPDVQGYAVKATSADQSERQVVVTLQYASSSERSLPVVLSAEHDPSPTIGVGGDRVETVNDVAVALWEYDGAYAAALLVDGVSYNVDVLSQPGSTKDEPELVRSRFVDAIASTAKAGW